MDPLGQVAQGVERDPASAVRAAAACAEAARARDDWAAASRAEAIRGRALHMLGELSLAERALRDAVAAAERQGDRDLEADALLALAGALSASGQHDEAFTALDQAAGVASPAVRRRTELQRAIVCFNVGRYDDAMRLFSAAVPVLRHDDEHLDLARVLTNRARLFEREHDLDAAATDLEEAVKLFRSAGKEFVALQVLSNLGCVAANAGDLPRALQMFDEASAGMAALGHDASVPLLARADALLLAGLSADAVAHAREAARRLGAAGNGLSAAKALLVTAEAAREEGDPQTAHDLACGARHTFSKGGADGWARAARVEMIAARRELGLVDADDLLQLTSLAAELAAAGDRRGELHARRLAAVIACELGQTTVATEQLEAAVQLGRNDGTLRTQIALHHANATVAFATGNIGGAKAALRAAFSAVAASTDLAAAIEPHAWLAADRRALSTLTMRVARRENGASRALTWMERERAAVGRFARVSTADGSKAVAFAQLRTVAAALRIAEREGQPCDDLRRQHAGLERDIRFARLAMPGESSPHQRSSFRVGALRAVLGDAIAVSIAVADGSAFAVVTDRARCRLVELGPWATTLDTVQRAATGLRGLATALGASQTAVDARRHALDAALVELDRLLLAPLRLGGGHLVAVLPPELHAVPWAAMPSMHGRSWSIAPSLAWWVDAATAPPAASGDALVVAGPRLPHAAGEAAGVAAAHGRATILGGDDATVDATLAAMPRHGIAHIVAHGRFRHDNPLWSTIELADGPLAVYELQRLERVPSIVVVATCESGAVHGRSGAQLAGLATALLGMGARTIVASIGALPDDEVTRDTMIDLHCGIRDGRPVADVLATRPRPRAHGFDVTSATLVTMGVGDR